LYFFNKKENALYNIRMRRYTQREFW